MLSIKKLCYYHHIIGFQTDSLAPIKVVNARAFQIYRPFYETSQTGP